MIGQRFGRLVVGEKTEIRLQGKSKHKTLYHHCICDCGKDLFVRKQSLKGGNTKSCGCYKNEHSKLIGRKNRKGKYTGKATINYLLRKYKYNASKRKITFDLCMEDFNKIIKENCYYCDKEPSQKIELSSQKLYYNGVDRIDSSKGYIKSNCVPCCKMCNIAKSSYSLSEFKEWISKVYNKHCKRG